MRETDKILRRIANNEATEEEMSKAEEYLHSFNQKLSLQIDDWEREEEKSNSRPLRIVWLRTAVATAACLILLFTVALWFDHSPNSIATATVTTQKDSYDNPEEAAAEAELVLMKFSQVINKATCYNTK